MLKNARRIHSLCRGLRADKKMNLSAPRDVLGTLARADKMQNCVSAKWPMVGDRLPLVIQHLLFREAASARLFRESKVLRKPKASGSPFGGCPACGDAS